MLERAVELLCRSRHPIALTGAGISTPSGIPDFRTPGKGLWEKADPMRVASIQAFRRDPAAFYRWMRDAFFRVHGAQPNAAHLALARLEAAGRLRAVITQNIDDLHRRAGSLEVLELHGHLRTGTCMDCFSGWPADQFLAVMEQGGVPRCPACGGVVKPDAILFGEQLPAAVLNAALEHAYQADLILVVGSSLMVMPAANLPALVHANGGVVVIFNEQPTYADEFAAAVFRGDLAETLPLVADACLEGER